MVEDDPDYNCCYETDESNVNPVCIISRIHSYSITQNRLKQRTLLS